MRGEGDVAVEVALDRDVGDNAHVRVAVTTGTPFGASPEELADLCETFAPCEEVDGATLLLESAQYPQAFRFGSALVFYLQTNMRNYAAWGLI